MAFLGGLSLLGATREAGLSMAEKRARIQQAQAQQEASQILPDILPEITGIPGIGQQPGDGQQPPISGLPGIGGQQPGAPPAPQAPPQAPPAPQRPGPAPPTSGAGGFGWGGPAPQQQAPVQFGYAGQSQEQPILAALRQLAQGLSQGAQGQQPQGYTGTVGPQQQPGQNIPQQRRALLAAQPNGNGGQQPGGQQQQVAQAQASQPQAQPQQQPQIPMPQRPRITTAGELAALIRRRKPNISAPAFNAAMAAGMRIIQQNDQQYWQAIGHRDAEQRMIDAQKQRDISNREIHQRDVEMGEARQQRLQIQKETQEAKKEKDIERKETIRQNIEGISSGLLPPVLSGLYKDRADIQAGLVEKGTNLQAKMLQWQRAQRQLASLSGPQMTRFFSLADSVQNTIKRTRENAEKLGLSKFPDWNKAKLQELVRFEGDTERGLAARQYLTDIAGLKEEFSSLIKGGYAPTESAFALADQQIGSEYGLKAMNATLDEISQLIDFRVNALLTLGGTTMTAPNPYLPGATTPGGGAQQQPPATPPVDYKTYFGGQ